MKSTRIFLIAACSILPVGLANAADDDIPLAEVPEKVVAAVKAKFSDAQMVSAEREKKADKTVYEVKITTGGTKKEVDVSEAGEILKVEDEK